MKALKRLRLWLIRKLKAVPEEEMIASHLPPPKIVRVDMPIVTLEMCEDVYYYNRNASYFTYPEDEEMVKRTIANKIFNSVIDNNLIEFAECENPIDMKKTVIGRLRVANPNH